MTLPTEASFFYKVNNSYVMFIDKIVYYLLTKYYAKSIIFCNVIVRIYVVFRYSWLAGNVFFRKNDDVMMKKFGGKIL